ncbi:MAG: RNA methyltransferase [Candidatus Omnitrophota bacterium]|jgi:TrmH family RNA methyltransferase
MKKASRMQIKNIRRLLKEKKVRDLENIFVAEGEKITKEILLKGDLLDSVFVSKTFGEKKKNKKFILDLEKRGIFVFEIEDNEFDKASSLQHSQGILAVSNKPDFSGYALLGGKSALVVLCDGIQDPGNLGTIIRTSVAMRADMVLLTGDCVDIFNPKVVRASSGMMLDIPVLEADEKTLDQLKGEGYFFLAGHAAKERSEDISKIRSLPSRLIVAFGSEGKGLSDTVLKKADKVFHIPVSEKCESLNVTSAVAIALYTVARIKRGE